MRQRMKAIETIKKVTHAMRLISMSIHGRIKQRRGTLDEYRTHLGNLIMTILHQHPLTQHPLLSQKNHLSNAKSLIIIVGSQKGLCGPFNAQLSALIKKEITPSSTNLDVIIVGKRAAEECAWLGNRITTTITNLNQAQCSSIAHRITDYIWHATKPYKTVHVLVNQPKTFFMHLAERIQLIPLSSSAIQGTAASLKEAYHWYHDATQILDVALHTYVQSSLHDLLLQSLIAEQAARFIAMDSATRNAKNLLETMKLDYNKLRQAKITRELTDLTASF